uniref:Putative secreted protein n=1 Tax=Ixodes ricinus TaxID=34613 RepID=A0A6B0U8D5_IXORI
MTLQTRICSFLSCLFFFSMFHRHVCWCRLIRMNCLKTSEGEEQTKVDIRLCHMTIGMTSLRAWWWTNTTQKTKHAPPPSTKRHL